MTTAEDYELLAAWRSGDDRAGNELVRRHFSSVSRMFRHKVAADGADPLPDLLQKTFLGCVESRDRVPDGLPFRVYLLGIARRVLAQHFREAMSPRVATALLDDPLASLASPSRLVAAKQEERLLLRALRGLALDLQLVVELFYWEQLTTEEVGHVLDVPAGTVKSRLHRAKAALREAVERLAPNDAVARSTIGDLEGWARSLQRYMDRPEPARKDRGPA